MISVTCFNFPKYFYSCALLSFTGRSVMLRCDGFSVRSCARIIGAKTLAGLVRGTTDRTRVPLPHYDVATGENLLLARAFHVLIESGGIPL
jgi:hypothetical protein